MTTFLLLALAAAPAGAAPAPVDAVGLAARFASARTPDPDVLVGRWKLVMHAREGSSLGAYDPAGLCLDADCHALEFERRTPHPAFDNIYSWEGLTSRVHAQRRQPADWEFNSNWGSSFDTGRDPVVHQDLAPYLQGEVAVIMSYRRLIAQYGERDPRGWGRPADSVMEGYCRMAGELLLCRVFTVTYSRWKPSGTPYHMHWRHAPAHILGYHKERVVAPLPVPPEQLYWN